MGLKLSNNSRTSLLELDKEPTHSLRLFVGWDMVQDCFLIYLRDYKRALSFLSTGLPVQATRMTDPNIIASYRLSLLIYCASFTVSSFFFFPTAPPDQNVCEYLTWELMSDLPQWIELRPRERIGDTLLLYIQQSDFVRSL